MYLFHNYISAPGFRSHASKIMNTFTCAIDALDKANGMNEVVKLIQDIGKSHARRRISKKSFNVSAIFKLYFKWLLDQLIFMVLFMFKIGTSRCFSECFN